MPLCVMDTCKNTYLKDILAAASKMSRFTDGHYIKREKKVRQNSALLQPPSLLVTPPPQPNIPSQRPVNNNNVGGSTNGHVSPSPSATSVIQKHHSQNRESFDLDFHITEILQMYDGKCPWPQTINHDAGSVDIDVGTVEEVEEDSILPVTSTRSAQSDGRLSTSKTTDHEAGPSRSRASSFNLPPITSDTETRWRPEISVCRDDGKSVRCRAVYDTGSEGGNFVSLDVIEELGASITRLSQPKEFSAANGDFSVKARSRLTIRIRDKTHWGEQFWIVPGAPFDILLGLHFIQKKGIAGHDFDGVFGIFEKKRSKKETKAEIEARVLRDVARVAQQHEDQLAREELETQKGQSGGSSTQSSKPPPKT